jgi:hypothetical protein
VMLVTFTLVLSFCVISCLLCSLLVGCGATSGGAGGEESPEDLHLDRGDECSQRLQAHAAGCLTNTHTCADSWRAQEGARC